MANKSKDKESKRSAPSGHDPAERVFSWMQQKKRPLTLGIGAMAIVGGSVWFMFSAQARREAFAANALQQARVSAESGNLQLAISDLNRVISEYGNTNSGADATILRARIQLQQGDAESAVTELRAFLNAGPDRDFRSRGAALLGTCLEQLGQYGEASQAFESAADASDYPYIRDSFLINAAQNAGLSGDVDRALGLYDRILSSGDEDSPVADEARMRKAELEGSIQQQS